MYFFKELHFAIITFAWANMSRAKSGVMMYNKLPSNTLEDKAFWVLFRPFFHYSDHLRWEL